MYRNLLSTVGTSKANLLIVERMASLMCATLHGRPGSGIAQVTKMGHSKDRKLEVWMSGEMEAGEGG